VARKSKQPNGIALSTPVDKLFHALNHPIRRQILSALISDVGSASTLAAALGESRSLISYHLNQVLASECDVVDLVDVVRKRGSEEKVYALKEASFVGKLSWPGVPRSVHASLRGVSLSEFLTAMIAAIEAGSLDSLPGSTCEWSPALVDVKGWLEIECAARNFSDAVRSAVGKSRARRQHQGSGREHHVIVGVAALEAAAPSSLAEGLAP
jgi:DNA-binding transcriptional ArsR family regulator